MVPGFETRSDRSLFLPSRYMCIYFSYFGTNEFCGFYPWALYMYQLWHTVYMCTFLKKLKFVIAHWVKGQFLYKSSTRHYTQVYVNWNSLQRLSCIIFISLKWKLYAMCIATILLNWHSTVSHFIWTTMLLPTAFQVFFLPFGQIGYAGSMVFLLMT